jgi:hypothetical protein
VGRNRFRWLGWLAAVILVAGLAVAAFVFYARHGLSAAAVRPAASKLATPATGGSAPAGALATVRQLASGTSATAQRAALTPELAAQLPAGRLFPAGTVFAPDAGSWAQSGGYAHLTGLLTVPGQAPSRVEVGLMLRGTQWLVTFEGQL